MVVAIASAITWTLPWPRRSIRTELGRKAIARRRAAARQNCEQAFGASVDTTLGQQFDLRAQVHVERVSDKIGQHAQVDVAVQQLRERSLSFLRVRKLVAKLIQQALTQRFHGCRRGRRMLVVKQCCRLRRDRTLSPVTPLPTAPEPRPPIADCGVRREDVRASQSVPGKPPSEPAGGPRSLFPSRAPTRPSRSADRRPAPLRAGRNTVARKCAAAAARAETSPDSAAETAVPRPRKRQRRTSSLREPTW